MIIVHIARIALTYESGMGRISCMWRDACLAQGHSFIHIGQTEVNSNAHVNLWGFDAKKYFENLNIHADVLLVHEPYGGFFSQYPAKLVVFSHGIEERAWHTQEKFGFQKVGWKSKLFPSWLRFKSNNKGFRHAHLILLSNNTDKEYLIQQKRISNTNIQIFKNGYYPFEIKKQVSESIIFLYNASWIGRKGKDLVIASFNQLLNKYSNVKLIIAGVGLSSEEVQADFIPNIRNQIIVISRFDAKQEAKLYEKTQVFILPSYFEGQSLALTQAMAMGLPVIAADNCGQLDFIQSGINGWLFKTGDAQDFFHKLETVVQNSELIYTMGIAAKNKVLKYTWPTVSQQIVHWLES